MLSRIDHNSTFHTSIDARMTEKHWLFTIIIVSRQLEILVITRWDGTMATIIITVCRNDYNNVLGEFPSSRKIIDIRSNQLRVGYKKMLHEQRNCYWDRTVTKWHGKAVFFVWNILWICVIFIPPTLVSFFIHSS